MGTNYELRMTGPLRFAREDDRPDEDGLLAELAGGHGKTVDAYLLEHWHGSRRAFSQAMSARPEPGSAPELGTLAWLEHHVREIKEEV